MRAKRQGSRGKSDWHTSGVNAPRILITQSAFGSEGIRCDRQQHARTSYSHVTTEMVHTMMGGAWRFVSCYESRVWKTTKKSK